MLKLFGGGKPDHALGDAKELKRTLDALPPDDIAALEEVGNWLDSVSSAEGFRLEHRVQTLFALDDAGQVRARKLGRDYFAAARPSRFQENRMWTATHGYWRAAGRSLARCIDAYLQQTKGSGSKVKPLLAALSARTLRCLAQQLKWMHLRYGPIDMSVWALVNNVYVFSEQEGVAEARINPWPATPGETTPREEFLRAAMFSACSPDSLLPLEAEIAERLIGAMVGQFSLQNAPGANLVYWIDLGQALPPQRIVTPPKASPGLRCFGAGGALAELEQAVEKTASMQQIPADFAYLGEDVEIALSVMQHLAMYWSPKPPARKAPRHAVKSRLAVTHGLESVLQALDDGGGIFVGGNPEVEAWVVENVSSGGFGAIVPQMKGDWLRVGALVAVQPEGGKNWLIGIVRRVAKSGSREARVGIETLSRAPRAVEISIGGVSTDQCIVLTGAGAASAEAVLALRPAVFAPGQNLEADFGGQHHVYMPQRVSERGEDYEIARFREMIRETGEE